MGKKRIAIFSSNVLLSRFFELEALLLDMKVEIFTDFSENITNYDLVIIDSDTVFAVPDAFYCPVSLVSSKFDEADLDNEKDGECYRLTWPTSVESIRKFLYMANISKNSDPHTTTEDKYNIIYCSSNYTGVVWYKNKKIELSEAEMKLLVCLCEANGNTVSRTDLNALFGANNGNIADVYIHHLRKKLETPFSYKLIYTVRSKGYCIKAKLKKYD